MTGPNRDRTTWAYAGPAGTGEQLDGAPAFVELPHTLDLRDRPVPPVAAGTAAERRRRQRRVRFSTVPMAIDLAVVAALVTAMALATDVGAAGMVFAAGLVLFAVLPREQRRPLTLSVADTAGAVARGACVAYAGASGFALLTGAGAGGELLAVAGTMTAAFLAVRSLVYGIARRARRRWGRMRTLIVGTGDVAYRLVAMLGQHADYGLDVVGVLDPAEPADPADRGDPADPADPADSASAPPMASAEGAVARLLQSQEVDVVLVAFAGGGYGSDARLAESIRGVMTLDIDVWVVPRFFDHDQASAVTEHIRSLPVRALRPPPHKRGEWLVKRAVDVVVGGVALVLLLPVLAVIAAVVALDLGRPVLFRQERVTADGRRFLMFKFRTMRPAAGPAGEEWAPSEQRMGRFGALLRRTSLDELPQLVNVLRGDMSLVGPRPERPPYVELFASRYPRYGQRHRVRAGVTGWAQVHGLRGDTSIEERAAFDNYYIDNWSLGMDVKILARTLRAFLTGR